MSHKHLLRCFCCGVWIRIHTDQEIIRGEAEILLIDSWTTHVFVNPLCKYLESTKGLPYIFGLVYKQFRAVGMTRKAHLIPTYVKFTMTCHVCMDRELQVAFLPCGHFCACGKCAPGLNKCTDVDRTVLRRREFMCINSLMFFFLINICISLSSFFFHYVRVRFIRSFSIETRIYHGGGRIFQIG